MTTHEFLAQLRGRLSGLPQADIEERLSFYSEMIEDRMEDGHAEEDAVAAAGAVEEIAAQIIADTPLSKIAKEKIKGNRQLSFWEILLLVLGSPLWLSLLLAAAATLLSVYLSVWAVIISLWAVFASLAGSSIGVIIAGIFFACTGNGLPGIAMLGFGCICAGLSIFTFYGCKAATNGILLLTKKIGLWLKRKLIRKEEA